MSSIGTTWEYPPPAAPPLIPKTGPSDGSLSATIAFLPILFIASPKPIDTVVLPSPAGVYTTCKNNTFNGMPLPPIWLLGADGNCRELVHFGYQDFKMRLGAK